MRLRDWFQKDREERKFAALWCGIALLAAVFWGRALEFSELRTALWVGAVLFALMGLLWPRALRGPLRAWQALGHFIGKINAVLILSVVYFTLLSGVALVMRILGQDPLARRLDRVRASYLERISGPRRARSRYERQF